MDVPGHDVIPNGIKENTYVVNNLETLNAGFIGVAHLRMTVACANTQHAGRLFITWSTMTRNMLSVGMLSVAFGNYQHYAHMNFTTASVVP